VRTQPSYTHSLCIHVTWLQNKCDNTECRQSTVRWPRQNCSFHFGKNVPLHFVISLNPIYFSAHWVVQCNGGCNAESDVGVRRTNAIMRSRCRPHCTRLTGLAQKTPSRKTRKKNRGVDKKLNKVGAWEWNVAATQEPHTCKHEYIDKLTLMPYVHTVYNGMHGLWYHWRRTECNTERGENKRNIACMTTQQRLSKHTLGTVIHYYVHHVYRSYVVEKCEGR